MRYLRQFVRDVIDGVKIGLAWSGVGARRSK